MLIMTDRPTEYAAHLDFIIRVDTFLLTTMSLYFEQLSRETSKSGMRLRLQCVEILAPEAPKRFPRIENCYIKI